MVGNQGDRHHRRAVRVKPHGIMFHHFCGGVHPQGQGAITAEELADLIEFVGPRRILPAEVWLVRCAGGTLRDGDVCLTLDDNLRCQYDIALPVLQAGDLVAIPASGAYAPSMASNYNLNPRPAIIMVKDGVPRLIRRRESYEDLMAWDVAD